LVCVGAPQYGATLAPGSATTVHLCADKAEALAVAAHISPGDVALVKASRSEKLEELADSITAKWMQKFKVIQEMKESEENA
jgi:UDP-N-acetylmuramoyl-tripeptide--D-alanyl-D-alanine ligase